MANKHKDQQIAALTEAVKEQQEIIINLVRHQSSITRRSVDEYLDAIKAREVIASLQGLLDKANEKVSKLTARRNYWRWRAENAHHEHHDNCWTIRCIDVGFLCKLYKEIGGLRKQNDALRRLLNRDWIATSERLPESSKLLCLCVIDADISFGYCDDGEGWLIRVDGIDSLQWAELSEVTHWLPVPLAPKESEDHDE